MSVQADREDNMEAPELGRQAVYAEFGIYYSAGVAAVENMADALVAVRAELGAVTAERDALLAAAPAVSADTRLIDYAADVRAFHVALNIPIADTPEIRRGELRANLIEEEARETVEAIRGGDLVEAIDGLCDLLCVVHGAAHEFGVDLAPFWREVHRSNMAKAGGPVREDGKVLKPAGWTPPDIAGLLAVVRGGGRHD